MYSGNSQIIESWMLFYAFSFYAMLAYYSFYTKEFDKWDENTKSYREKTTTQELLASSSVIEKNVRESLFDDNDNTATSDMKDKMRDKKIQKLLEA